MAVFRVEKTKDFTIMSNHHLRNAELSLKAKGLLSLMLSLPEDWDYTTKGLAHICKDGVDSITTALKELERHGYLTRQRLRYDNGQLGDIEYTIHEKPVTLEKQEVSPKRENPRQVNPRQAKPEQAEPEQEKPAQLNTNPQRTKKSKTDISRTYQSSILISCGARLAPFDIKEVREITMYDELELDLVGDRKTALFFIISDTDATFNFLVSMAYTQLFNLLCERADDKYGGRLPVHVRCLIDEAANIGQIPNLEKLMATIRSREISACLVLQAQSQLKALYKDNMDTIIGNCDASLFLGGKEETTLKSWNSLLGKETIDMYNTSVTKGTQESHGQNYQKLGKDLMSVDELAVMDGGKCLLQIRGVRPFLSRKYDITKHPNYKYLSDYNEKNAFDIEKFLSTRLPVRPGELYRNYEISAEDLETKTA